MCEELDNFIICYDKEINYIEDVKKNLVTQTSKILSFFNLEKLSKKKKIIIFSNLEDYKNHLLKYMNEYKEWMCGDVFEDNINLLDINEARKTKEHNDMTMNEFLKIVIHEFVHSCQQELNSNITKTNWYWEALAINLSKQEYNKINLNECDFKKLKKDFNNTKNSFNYAYMIGKFMLNNYSNEKLIEYIRDEKLLNKDSNKIFKEALNYYKKNNIL